MMLVQDTDFNALLQDIASGPAPVHDLRTGKHEGLEDAPDEATGSQPSSEGEKDTMADSASEDVAAASLSAERKSLRQRFNPMRGFLSRRPSSVSTSPCLCMSSRLSCGAPAIYRGATSIVFCHAISPLRCQC